MSELGKVMCDIKSSFLKYKKIIPVIASRVLALCGEAIPYQLMRLLRAKEHRPRNDDIDLWRGGEQTLKVCAFFIGDGMIKRVSGAFDLLQRAPRLAGRPVNGVEKFDGTDPAGA